MSLQTIAPATDPAAGPEAGASGLAWPDVARGITVLLVVSMHMHRLLFVRVVPEAPATAAVALVAPGTMIDHPALALVTSAACVAASLMLLERVADARVLEPIRHIGRNTLAIFAMHPLLILAAGKLLRAWDAGRHLIATDWWWSTLAPVVGVALIAVVALGLQAALERIGLHHLFEMPRFRRLRRRYRLRHAVTED